MRASKPKSDEESDFEDEEMAMPRKFKKFFKKSRERRKFRNLKNQKEKKEVIICYECKKVMVATWDDSDEESSDEEDSQEVSNLVLIAIGDDEFDEVNDLPTYNELYDAFKELHNDMMKIGKKNALK